MALNGSILNFQWTAPQSSLEFTPFLSVNYVTIQNFTFSGFGVSAPSSAPEIVSVTASATSIHLRYKAPVYINAPLLSYRVTVVTLNSTDIPKVRHYPVVGTNVDLSGLDLKDAEHWC